ncbi:hypothetical protein TEA_025164 [Camellia sinensis var. sinensis]|uniref:BHLH domain-containing protein n=1 Tax=Camellia sinensis var. sinensis TaxID=542762 RepID=A0A4S4D3Z9_CAMSN|nr:hypothetical protein TEA_025164 [Camellia sinensis var. sinensis]
MDPPIINLTSFSAANPSSYSLAEIWPCPINGNVVGSGGGLGLRMSNLTGFCDSASNRDVSMDESTVTEQSGSRSGGGGRKRRDASSGDDESSNLSGNDLNNSDGKRMKLSRSRVENGGSNSKSKMESNSGQGNMAAEKHTKPSEEPNKQDYIHISVCRLKLVVCQARREKIGERMKILQDLVPGCNKVIGKALILDEIINYIQSLHHQVEFLSMKLEAVNSRMNSTIEVFPSKDLGTPTFDAAAAAGMIFSSQATREYVQGSQTEWLHMQVGSSFDRAA